jgi:tellurite resistance protein TerC
MSTQALLWLGFGILVAAALAIDLGFFQRKAHVVRPREAILWSIIWVVLALAFNVVVYHFRGKEAALQFLTGYLVEKSLSVDNLFVFLMIFSYFGVPREHESRILMWGVLGAILTRAIFIVAGTELMKRFAWTTYVFGGILILTGLKLLVKKEGVIEPEKNPVVRLFRKLFPVSPRLDGQRFFTRVDGKLMATPLFITLIVVETTDVVFAVDSVPAIFAVVTPPDTFLIYTSNVFAILGLRQLYFLLAHLMGAFRFLKFGLVFILVFVGVKMLLAHSPYKVPTNVSLAVIGGTLAVSVIASLLFPARRPEDAPKVPANTPPSE